MSASLVGSEMCIRDRTLKPRPSAFAARALCGVALVGAAGRLRRGIAESGPVSYTHLTLPTICSV
eukprot:6689684-Alexandrium_andersonii.AAC.1